MASGMDVLEMVDREIDRRREEGLCVRCGHARSEHPWTATHHTGCDEQGCRCPGFTD